MKKIVMMVAVMFMTACGDGEPDVLRDIDKAVEYMKEKGGSLAEESKKWGQELRNCLREAGCSIRPKDGEDGADGAVGAAGEAGQDGSIGAKGETGPAGQDGADAPAVQLILTAIKTYGPSTWYDANYEGDEYEATIPAIVPVLTGNSGNHWITLTLNDISCQYKGQASVSKPLNPYNFSQVKKGQIYKLDPSNSDPECVAGDKITITEASLTVNNGDSTMPTTVQTEL